MNPLLIKALRSTTLGNWLYRWQRQVRSIQTEIDYDFPSLVNLEIASCCNLHCKHCPSHNDLSNNKVREFGFMDKELFFRCMHEVDMHGDRRISLHKDGEPLLHPHLEEILYRVKKHRNHSVYLTTNGIKLTKAISQQILDAKIDLLNVSIGAASSEKYRQIRGGDLDLAVSNVKAFLEIKTRSLWKTKVIVQIIDLEDLDMRQEIIDFKEYWKNYDVEVQVWDELTWGEKMSKKHSLHRYPCLSLWDSCNVNADGTVTACCMDWKQSLIIGKCPHQSIAEIWHGQKLRDFRTMHMRNDLQNMPLCVNCNYWQWQLMPLKHHE